LHGLVAKRSFISLLETGMSASDSPTRYSLLRLTNDIDSDIAKLNRQRAIQVKDVLWKIEAISPESWKSMSSATHIAKINGSYVSEQWTTKLVNELVDLRERDRFFDPKCSLKGQSFCLN
jgi:hypothetical protein